MFKDVIKYKKIATNYFFQYSLPYFFFKFNTFIKNNLKFLIIIKTLLEIIIINNLLQISFYTPQSKDEYLYTSLLQFNAKRFI